MPENATPTPQGTRATQSGGRRAPKAKTGCKTCKIRKVKCDESKPQCRKCTDTGRKCDGYGQSLISGSATTTRSPPFALPLIASNEPLESWFLDLFRQHIAKAAISGRGGWASLVSQMSLLDNASRYATIAIALCYEMHTHGMQSFGMESRVTMYYCKAIEEVQKNLTLLSSTKASFVDPQILTSLLIVASLLIGIDILRGKPEFAYIHLKNSLRITKQYKPKEKRITLRNSGSFESFFSRMKLHFESFPSYNRRNHGLSDELTLFNPFPVEGPPYFSNEDQALEFVYTLLNDAQSYLNYLERRPRPLSTAEITKIDNILFRIEQWQIAIQLYISRLEHMSEFQVRGGMTTLLQMHTKVISFRLEAERYGEEVYYDSFTDGFADVYENVCALPEDFGLGLKLRFSTHAQAIELIYYIAVKCRNPHLRRKAISWLEKSAVQQGFWDGRPLAAVTKRIVEIEEERASALQRVLHRAEDVPEFSRLRYVKINVDFLGRTVGLKYLRSAGCGILQPIEETLIW